MSWTYPEIYVLRHGQTEWNAIGRFQGHLDSPLTEQGQRQAMKQRDILSQLDLTAIDIFSSPQGRAYQTALLAVGPAGDKVRKDDRLMEIGMGSWAGADKTEIPNYPDDSGDMTAALGIYERAPGGEGFEALKLRCQSFLNDLTRPSVIVTHGITSRMLRVLHMGLEVDSLGVVPGGQGVVYHMKAGEHLRLDVPE